MPQDYGTWSLASLKAELRKRNAKVTGRKAVLVQRLLDYDMMFGGLVNDPDSVYHISVPGLENFHDVNSDSVLPIITEADIYAYSILGERENLTTSKNMYDENYLLTSRSVHSGTSTFVTAVCAAEMKKNITYNVTLKVEQNSILEAQCECAAGMGPYSQCKHVLVLMYGLLDFTNNKIIKTRVSPTSNLQTFHQPPQMYTGEPCRVDQLKLKIKDENLKKIATFDPRSNATNKEMFTEHHINLTNNYVANHQKTIPIQQLSEPANKMAVYRDHDYEEKTMEQIYLDSLTLSDEQRKKLEIKTRTNKKLWKRMRQMRLHSSDFGRICKTTNPAKLSKDILKRKEIVSIPTKHGLKYEKAAIRELAYATSVEVKKCGIVVHPEQQYLACTPDGTFDEEGVVEVKCPYSARNQPISPETVPYIYLSEEDGQWKLKENHNHYYQIQGQMLCTGRLICYFGIYTISDFCIIKIERNTEFIEEMLGKLKLFYNDHYKHNFLCKYLYNIKM